ncbi:MAG: GTPase HflX, partial [Nitrospirota bacterium]|nr:GTPase HflX [Nitrospirota bacterium]
MPVDKVITIELAKTCTELSHEIRRQIGLIINRRGNIESVIVGTDRQLVIPLLARSRSGSKLLRGVRLVHTHLHNQPLTKEDLTDLALLRLDLMAVIGIGNSGEPMDISIAHLIPSKRSSQPYEELKPCPFFSFQLDCGVFVQDLENEILRSGSNLRLVGTGPGAIIVSVFTGPQGDHEYRLEETKELAVSQGIHVFDTVIQRLPQINPKYVLGIGKIREVIIQALQMGADMLIFDRDLTPAQVRAISEMTEMKVLDRTQVILDIFAKRAHTRAGKIQVELAQLRYILPRLSQSSTALSRLGGGIGGRGPGETKLETDHRRVRDRIGHLERELLALSHHRGQQRSKRTRHAVPVVSIVGYTNAGKSTLLNALTHSQVSTKDRPFETLDTVSRRLHLPTGDGVILTDTVGFIRDLPNDLLKAFRTTLEELHDADVLLHVVDISAQDLNQQIDAVDTILR